MKAEIIKDVTLTVKAGSVVEITAEQFKLLGNAAKEHKEAKKTKKTEDK